MTVDEPTSIEELARSLEEPLLSQSTTTEDYEVVEEDEISRSTVDGSENQRNDRESPVLCDGLPLKDSLLIKSLYFLDALGSSSFGRFSAIYYNSHGLNTQQVGIIEGLRTITPTVSSTFWGFVSDRFRCRKLVWIWTKSGSTAILLLLAVPWVTETFSRILSVSVGAQLFTSNGAILDSYTLEMLGTGNKLLYGRYRLYASCSWGLGSIVMGWVTDNFGFDWNFIMFGGLSSLMIVLVSYCIPDTRKTQEETIPNEHNANESNEEGALDEESEYNDADTDAVVDVGDIFDLLNLFIKPRVLFFLVEVIIMGAAMATVERLLFLYLVNDLFASTLLCGLSVGVNVLFELPIFWHASSILKYLGSDGMFLLSMTCFVVRVFGYTLLTPSTKWWILPLESMHGVTFATFWIVTTDISKGLIDESKGGYWSTTIPSVVQMLYTAVGATIGSVLGGFAMHRFGSKQMYRFTAGSVFCLLLVHLVGSVIVRICCHRFESLLPESPHQIDTEENGEDDVYQLVEDDVDQTSEEDAEDGS